MIFNKCSCNLFPQYPPILNTGSPFLHTSKYQFLGIGTNSRLNPNFGSLAIGLPTLPRPQLSSSTSQWQSWHHHMDRIIGRNGPGTERNWRLAFLKAESRLSWHRPSTLPLIQYRRSILHVFPVEIKLSFPSPWHPFSAEVCHQSLNTTRLMDHVLGKIQVYFFDTATVMSKIGGLCHWTSFHQDGYSLVNEHNYKKSQFFMGISTIKCNFW